MADRHHSRTVHFFLGFTVALTSAPAAACERVGPTFRLPGESDDIVEKRATQILSDQLGVIADLGREERALAQAKSVYLARVIEQVKGGRAADGQWIRPSTLVEPVKVLKGSAEVSKKRLVDESSSCSLLGDGLGAFATIGSYVVVFAGLPNSTFYPRGTYSIPADSVRSSEMINLIMRVYGEYEE